MSASLPEKVASAVADELMLRLRWSLSRDVSLPGWRFIIVGVPDADETPVMAQGVLRDADFGKTAGVGGPDVLLMACVADTARLYAHSIRLDAELVTRLTQEVDQEAFDRSS